MSWQEELQQLDAELAQGRVTPEDYRLRRDQLLGVAQQATNNPPSNPVPAQPEQQPQQQPGSPFGQPFRWQPSNPGSGGVESTQVMQPIKDDKPAEDGAERTQVVRNQPGDHAERTQVVRGPAPQQPQQPGFPPPNYQGGFGTAAPTWAQQPGGQPGQPGQPGQMSGAPWDEDPAPPNFNDVSWMRQGPEVFSDSTSKRGRILVIAGIVVVLLLIGFGTYWFGFRNAGGNTPVATGTTTPTTTTPSLPPTIAPGRVPQMPGTPVAGKGGTTSIDEAVSKGVLDSATGAAMTKAGASFVTFDAADNAPFHYAITLVNAKTVNQAKTLTTTLANPTKESGFQPVADHAGLAEGVNVFKAVLPDHTTFRAVYTSGAAVLQIDVSEAPANDTNVTHEFQTVMKAMLENIPLS